MNFLPLEFLKVRFSEQCAADPDGGRGYHRRAVQARASVLGYPCAVCCSVKVCDKARNVWLGTDRVSQVKPINERLRQLGQRAKLAIDLLDISDRRMERAFQYALG